MKTKNRVVIVLLSLAALGLLALIALSQGTARASSRTIDIVYAGNRRSEIEHCGCRKKQLGGIDREASLLSDIRKTTATVAVIDSGGFIDTFLSDTERLKSAYLLKSLAVMNLDAVNVAHTDLAYGVGELKAAAAQLHLISANIVDKATSQPIFTPYRIVQKNIPGGTDTITIGIIGVTRTREQAVRGRPLLKTVPRQPTPRVSPAPTPAQPQDDFTIDSTTKMNLGFGPAAQKTPGAKQTPINIPGIAVPQHLLQKQETAYRAPTPPPSELKPQSHLFKDTLKDTLRDAEVGEDEIVLGRSRAKGGGADPQNPHEEQAVSSASQAGKTPADAPQTDFLDPLATLKRLVPEVRKQCDILIVAAYVEREEVKSIIPQVPGIDLFIAGATKVMQAEPQKTADTLVVTPASDGKYVGNVVLTLNEKNQITRAFGKQLEVSTDVPAEPRVVQLIAEYKKELEKRRAAEQPRPAGPRVMFAGAHTCKSCHASQYQQWEKTPHARAFQALVGRDKQNSSDCVKCHVTGYLTDNGFRTQSETPLMANVQCEVCHGAAQRHTIEERLRTQRAAQASVIKSPPAETPRRYLPTRAVAADLCTKCHDAKWDPKFNYEHDVKIISH